MVERGRGGTASLTFFDRGDASPTPPFFGLKFMHKLVHRCNWLLTETQCKIISVEQSGEWGCSNVGVLLHWSIAGTFFFVGAVNNAARLPWHLWTRQAQFFLGCVWGLRINDEPVEDLPRFASEQQVPAACCHVIKHTPTHARLTALCPGLPGSDILVLEFVLLVVFI